MNHKSPIRVVKRGQRRSESRPTETPADAGNNLRRSARDAADSVASWVREFKERRPADPRKAFARLFGESSPTLKSLT